MSTDRVGFRPDVEGLRAVAVLAVVLSHAGVPAAAGGYVGVDVFFVISGFLITGLLVRELQAAGTVSLTRFYARRAKRLLPQAAIALAFVCVAAALLFDPVRRDVVSGDVIAATLSYVNWHFAHQAVDYFAAGPDMSPVRHFWSLAVEEQFYVVWPSLLLAATWWPRRRGRDMRPVAWGLLALIGGGSLAWGLAQTASQPDVAYFSTLTRAWELAAGGALALAPTLLARLPRRIAVALGWGGLTGVVVAVLAFTPTTPFPGVAALLPVLATAALIAGGAAAPLWLLTVTPVRYVGRISYSWYLWHWPLYVFATAEWGPLTWRQGLAVMAVSLVPTIVTHHLVEDPLHHARVLAQRPRLALRLGGVCLAVALLAGVLVSATAPTIRTASRSQITGARDIAQPGFHLQETVDAVRPNPRDADADRPAIYRAGCFLGRTDLHTPSCVFGDPDGATHVVLLGDSHAAMYDPALEAIARRRGWRLEALTKQACFPATVAMWNDPIARAYVECDRWREQILRRIERERPDMVVVTGSNAYEVARDGRRQSPAASRPVLRAGMETTLRRLQRTGAKVVAIAETPWSPRDVPSCVSGHAHDLRECAFSAGVGYRRGSIIVPAARDVGHVHVIDPRPVVCPGGLCPAVVGNVLVWRDDNHLTATYARTLAGWLSSQLADAAR
jgi:peptidoglycan/LPS O-acetylase OafA/YrhL